ncbi:MAG TPA: TlpA disulfide reductase family protein [Vicinamibacterales bacterium]|jgi:thiol-disulfide isomerase/thioredoxin|nr:TlpA disulfide reductase family protein [Vicinamibacterales bacterium]
MNERRALLLVLVLGGVLMTWAAARYARQVEDRQSETVVAAAGAADTDKVTLRFFRDPKPAPAFTVKDLDGRDIAPASLRGKVVIVNFWATWCGPCRAEIPDLVALQDKYKDTLQVIGISEDEAGVDVVRRFAAEHKINYPVAMMTPEIEKMYPGITALPTSFILDRESRVVQKHVGMLTARTTEFETRHLAGLPVNVSIEEVDQSQGLKLNLENGAQAMTIPGIDLASLPMAKRIEALQKLNSQPCTCGCDLTVARCRVDDPTCGVSLPLARQIVKQISGTN